MMLDPLVRSAPCCCSSVFWYASRSSQAQVLGPAIVCIQCLGHQTYSSYSTARQWFLRRQCRHLTRSPSIRCVSRCIVHAVVLILGIYTNHLIPFGPSLWFGHPSWSWSRHLSCTVIACSVLLNIIMRYCIMIWCACPTLSTSNARDALITNRHVVCVLQSFLLVHGVTFDK